MKQFRVDFVLEAIQPIAHHEETIGNTAVVMRRKIRQRDGSWSKVPVITADTMRHGLREASTYALLDAADMLDEAKLSEAALRLLFSGGMITGSSGGSIKLGDYYDMIDLLPPLAILGGCAQNRVIPGRINVDDAVLICAESIHLMPKWVCKWASQADKSRAHLEEVQRVRMDPTLDPGKRKFLTTGAEELVQQRLQKSETASEMEDSVAKEKEKSSMMPRRFERVAQGSLFYWSLCVTTYSEIEESTFWVMVAAFLANARVGGKKGTGHGLLQAVASAERDLVRPKDAASTIDASVVGESNAKAFRDHVSDRSQKIRDFLQQVLA